MEEPTVGSVGSEAPVDRPARSKRRKRWLGPHARSSVRAAVLVFLALGVFGSAVAFPRDITVTINGRTHRVPARTTLGEALTIVHMHARPGSLLDVEGVTIRAAATRGRVLLDGRQRGSATALRSGDVIRVVDGPDQTEALKRVERRIGRDLANPQFRLESIPGIEVITQGAVSGKVAGVVFSPTHGAAKPQRAVALTFDDGPSETTPRVLAVLKRFHVRATFFLVGSQVLKYPKLVKAELAAGMVVGDHSWSHPIRPPFARLSQAAQRREMVTAQRVVSLLGKTPKLFRPPGGSISETVIANAKKLGMRVVMWSIDPKDWRRGTSASSIASRVLSQVAPGSIILLHDGGGNTEHTLAALPTIIRGIMARGLKVVPVLP